MQITQAFNSNKANRAYDMQTTNTCKYHERESAPVRVVRHFARDTLSRIVATEVLFPAPSLTLCVHLPLNPTATR